MNKIKHRGEVYTPRKIVDLILDFAGYKTDILGKHIIDNSCGDGAFLTAVAERYIKAARSQGCSNDKITSDLSTYVHGIEIEETAARACKENLNTVASKYKLALPIWDIINSNTLEVDKFNDKMDYVVGNPPYVRVHNLNDSYNSVKEYEFAATGMTDLFIVFFEIGLKMLCSTGKLCLISPSSFLNSTAGAGMRDYIIKNKTLDAIIDFEHEQQFDGITTYSAISLFDNQKKNDTFKYYRYADGKLVFIDDINFNIANKNSAIVLGTFKDYKLLEEIESANNSILRFEDTIVKNGFATLADKIFIGDFDLNDDLIIDVIKASTGKWHKCVFPYKFPGKLIEHDEIVHEHALVYTYLSSYKAELANRSSENNSAWYSFGRSQAIHDVFKDKISINSIIKDKESIKLHRVPEGCGIYSGLYILTSHSYNEIKDLVVRDEFIDYLKLLRKYKSGGYYTFSSKDLVRYLTYMERR